MSNYNKIKTDLDKLRLLVEQSELWVFKKKDHCNLQLKGSKNNINETEEKTQTPSDSAKSSAPSCRINAFKSKQNESIIGDHCVLQELDHGPELEETAIVKYKELYKILYSMIKLCVTETCMSNGTFKKKPRRNDQRLLRNMGVHNIVLGKILLKKCQEWVNTSICS